MIQTESCTSWKDALQDEKEKPYFKKIMAFLEEEQARGKIIYPPKGDIFNALKAAPFDQIKVVILGQDPYHGPNQAHGMCFSVKKSSVTKALFTISTGPTVSILLSLIYLT